MDIASLIIEKRLQEALKAMKSVVEQDTTPWDIKREYQEVCSTYASLLEYFRNGADDPIREMVFIRLCGKALIVNDKCRFPAHAEGTRGSAVSDFGAASFWTSEEVSAATARLRATDGRADEQCMLVSSLMISLMRVFDPAKMPVLCEAVYSKHDAVAVRAVTAIAIVIRLYASRLPFYPNIKARLRNLGDDSVFTDLLSDIELQFIRSRDTEKIERQMKEDIIPAMLRHPGAQGKPIVTPDELMDGGNPEWDKWLKESGIEESLRELTELQMNGADVYMATFSSLKHYPFFQTMANWFRPFDPTHPEVAELFNDAPATGAASSRPPLTLQRLVMRSGIFCNSDKYSFCLTLKELPRQQLDLLRSQMAEQEEALREELSDNLPDSSSAKKNRNALSSDSTSPRTLIRQYIQDLYRFFHLSPERKQFPNPFSTAGSLSASDPLHAFYPFSSPALLAALELNLQRHDYTAALEGFDALRARFPEAMDATLWQKCGYCYQQTEQYDKAIEALVMADILKPDHYWTILHLAQCHRRLGHYTDAFNHYHRAAEMKPDNLQLDYQQASCLMHLEFYEMALFHLHKIAYREPDSLKIQRAIIRSHLMQRESKQAMKHVDRILADPSFDLTNEDLHLIAAAQWLTGDRPSAIRTLQALGEAPSLTLLASLGIDSADLPFLRDCLIE